MKIVYIILVIAALVCLYYWMSEKPVKGVAALPAAFASYQPIDSVPVVRSGKLQMSLLLESIQDIQSFLTPDSNVIIYTVPVKNRNAFFKIARMGDVADSFTLDARPEHIAFVKGFILNKESNQYYKWSFNGSKEPIPATIENARLAWDNGKQERQLASIVKESAMFFVDYLFDDPLPQPPVKEGELQTTQAMKTYAVITYFRNEDCFRFYTTLDVGKQFSYAQTEAVLWSNLFKRVEDKKIIPTPAVQYRYFHKQQVEKVYFSGGGGNAPGFTQMLYPGYLFTDVVFKNDTLRLKEHMYLDEEWHTSDIVIDGKKLGALTKNKAQPPQIIDAYMYYTNPALAYALFSNDDKKLYLIK